MVNVVAVGAPGIVLQRDGGYIHQTHEDTRPTSHVFGIVFLAYKGLPVQRSISLHREGNVCGLCKKEAQGCVCPALR